MKRLIILTLCLCLVFCGCGSNSGKKTHTNEIYSSPDIVYEAATPISSSASISETVVFDSGDFKLTAKEIDFSDDRDVKVKFLAENNSDANVSFSGNYFSINGITMYCSFYIKVAAGKKANDFLEIDKDDLAYYGITDIATIKAQDAQIYNKDTSENIVDFRFELVTSNAGKFRQKIDRSGQTLYDQNGIIIKYRGMILDRSGDEELEFFIENTSNDNIGVYVDDVSVNGFMVYGSMVAYAYPGCVTYVTLGFSSSDMEANDIESIEEVSLSFHGTDMDTRDRVWVTEEFTLREFLR